MSLETLQSSQIQPSTSSFVGGRHYDVIYTTLARFWCPILFLHGQGLASPACSGCIRSGMCRTDKSWLLLDYSANMEDVASGSDCQAFLVFASLLSRGREGPPVKQPCHCPQHCGSHFPGLAEQCLAL